MKVLVTGGAGYIGSAIVRRLAAAGHQPVVYDNLITGNRHAVPEDVPLIRANLCDDLDLCSRLNGYAIEAVVHCAALASVPRSIKRPAQYYETNLIGTRNLLGAMRVADVARLVFASTAAVYSHDQTMPLLETSRVAPVTPYGDTKLAAERMIHHYAMAGYGIAYAHLRFFNVAGADEDGQHGEARQVEEHLIPRVLAVATGRATDVEIHGADYLTSRDGTCIRDYVHVSDVASAAQLVLENLRIGKSDIYNVCNVRASVRDVLRAAETVAGRPIACTVGPRRPGDPGVLTGSSAKLRERYGWKPRHNSIEDIVGSAWAWFREHPSGY